MSESVFNPPLFFQMESSSEVTADSAFLARSDCQQQNLLLLPSKLLASLGVVYEFEGFPLTIAL